MLLYLAYGSNLSSHRLEVRVGTVRCMGPVWVPGYRHRFSKLGRDGSGQGNLEPVEGVGREESAFGVLYRLDPEQWTALLPYEGGYDRREVEVFGPASRALRAETFIAQRVVEGLVPTPEYTAHYARGLEEHGLPGWYREQILGPWLG